MAHVESSEEKEEEQDKEELEGGEGGSGEGEEEEEETCGFCRFMKGGACREVFIVRAREGAPEAAREQRGSRRRATLNRSAAAAPHPPLRCPLSADPPFRPGRSAWTRTASPARTLWTPARPSRSR